MTLYNCPECNAKLNLEEKKIFTYQSCPNCGYESIDYPQTCCVYPEIKTVRYYKDDIDCMMDNDNYFIFEICLTCGIKHSKAISKSKFKKDDLERFSQERFVEESKELNEERNQFVSELNKRQKERKNYDFWRDYNEYLKSEKWKQIREIILKRDNYVCQSCLCNKAEEVHHMDSRFRKNEPLFTLVSVCKRCHDIITEIENGGIKKAPIIEYEFNKRTTAYRVDSPA